MNESEVGLQGRENDTTTSLSLIIAEIFIINWKCYFQHP